MPLHPFYQQSPPPYPLPLPYPILDDQDIAKGKGKSWIKTVDDLMDLEIIDWNRRPRFMSREETIKLISKFLINSTTYSFIHDDLRRYPERNDFPGWQHPGKHVEIGRRYWNCFQSRFEGVLRFHDAPDFSGHFVDEGQTCIFRGDIGKISAVSFFYEVMTCWNQGELWISILNDKTQVLLEPMTDISGLMTVGTLLD